MLYVLSVIVNSFYKFITQHALIKSSTECLDDNMFPCSEALSDNLMCVSELQYCDGVADCPAGSDEPADCQSGTCKCA